MVASPNMIPVMVGKKDKTDQIDSNKLAVFHCKGLLSGIWIPPEELHNYRALQRVRDETQKAKKVLMAQIKAKFSEYGIGFLNQATGPRPILPRYLISIWVPVN